MITAGLLFTSYSCVDLDTEKETLADAFICSKVVDADTLYLVGGYVTSNTTMKSIAMKDPSGTLLADLNKMNYYGTYFEKLIKAEDFSSQKPVKGYYKFEIEYDDGTACDTTDYVSADIIKPIEIKSVSANSDDRSVKVEWIKDSKSDYYIMRILRGDSIVFISYNIDPSYSSAVVYANSNGWVNNISPTSGDSLNVLISGVQLEDGNLQYSEIQSVSFSSPVGVVWPE